MNILKKIIYIPIIISLIIPSMRVDAFNEITVGTGKIYKKTNVKVNESIYRLDYIDEEISEDAKKKIEVLSNEKVLIPMTDSQYEVTLAYVNGEYEFVSETNDIKEAISICDSIGLGNKSGQDVVGAVINNHGNVVYSTNGVGQVKKYINGELDKNGKHISNIYQNSGLTTAHTYINHLSIDDVAIISHSGDSAQIQYSSNIGWIKSANASGNYDLVVVPITQYKNPSYYYTKNGVLYHFISKDIKSSSEIGDYVKLGPAPKELIEGKKYLSFDGRYFYEIGTVGQAYTNLITDLRNGTNGQRANNENNEYYNYYNYLPFRTKTSYTANELNKFIEKNTKPESKLRGLGKALKESEEKYGINALLTLSVSINESGWGMSGYAQNRNNLFGIRADDSNEDGATFFKTPGDSVLEFTKNFISREYSNPNSWKSYGAILGNKDIGANVKYASDPFWGEKAAGIAFRIDEYLSNNELNNLKDYNNYQLIRVTGDATIYNNENQELYKVEKNKSKGILKQGVILPLNTLNVINSTRGMEYKVNPDTVKKATDIENIGEYNYNVKGYIDVNKTKMVNEVKSDSIVYIRGDFNEDRVVNITDLSMIAAKYNETVNEKNLNKSYDLNNDGIVDIFDLVLVSKKL